MKHRGRNLTSLEQPLCVAFANTLHNHGSAEPRDDLADYTGLANWIQQEGATTTGESKELVREAARRPRAAATVFREAVEIRQVIYRIFSAGIKRRAPEVTDLATFNSALGEALFHSRIVQRTGSFALECDRSKRPLNWILWPVLQSAAELLTSEQLTRLRECAGVDCTWLFLDRSKNGTRRWCDMKGCGNRAKSRRHYERHRFTG